MWTAAKGKRRSKWKARVLQKGVWKPERGLERNGVTVEENGYTQEQNSCGKTKTSVIGEKR